MIGKHLDRINDLLNRTKTDGQAHNDSIALISTNMGRTTKTDASRIRSKTFISTKVTFKAHELGDQLQTVLKGLFRAKCKDLRIEVNQVSWELFVKTFVVKNKILEGSMVSVCLNLGNFALTPSCLPYVNKLIGSSSFEMVNLSRNLVDPTSIRLLTTIQELSLNNCKLGNDVLEKLFVQLMDSGIVKISLSSPELKDRNQLTRYEKLIALIKKSRTLQTVSLSNIQIQAESRIIENCKGTSLKHLDLSDNTNVKGINASLLELNLSRNGISSPFELPLPICQLQSLDLSANKIPYYLFKNFLKVLYFPALSQLTLDRIQLNGSIFPIQQFVEQSLSLRSLSLVDCDLSIQSYGNITTGVRGNRNSLKSVDLSRNRVTQERIAQGLSDMLMGGSLTHLKMRHCDLKDHLGSIIFRGVSRSQTIESIDMMFNLLGDETARTICSSLKKAKFLTELKLDQNIIKYKDREEIDGYLESNKYTDIANMNVQYEECKRANKEQEQNNRTLKEKEGLCRQLQGETRELENKYLDKFRVSNVEKKEHLRTKIDRLRKIETTMQEELFIRETMLVPSMAELGLRSHRESCYENPEINIPSPR